MGTFEQRGKDSRNSRTFRQGLRERHRANGSNAEELVMLPGPIDCNYRPVASGRAPPKQSSDARQSGHRPQPLFFGDATRGRAYAVHQVSFRPR